MLDIAHMSSQAPCVHSLFDEHWGICSVPDVYTTADDKQVLNMVSWNFLGLAGDSSIEASHALHVVPKHRAVQASMSTMRNKPFSDSASKPFRPFDSFCSSALLAIPDLHYFCYCSAMPFCNLRMHTLCVICA